MNTRITMSSGPAAPSVAPALMLPERARVFLMWSSSTTRHELQTHPWHEVILPIRGLYRVMLAKREHPVLPGQFAAFPAGVAHQPRTGRDTGVHWLVVAWWGGMAPRPGVHDDHLRRAMGAAEWLHDLQTMGVPDTHLGSRVLAGLIAMQSLAESRRAAVSPTIARVLREFEDKLHDPLSLREMADIAGWTPQHLIRRFRAEFGMSPMAWLRNLRLQQARLLLSQGLDTPAVAQRCGYANNRTLRQALRQVVRQGARRR